MHDTTRNVHKIFSALNLTKTKRQNFYKKLQHFTWKYENKSALPAYTAKMLPAKVKDEKIAQEGIREDEEIKMGNSIL